MASTLADAPHGRDDDRRHTRDEVDPAEADSPNADQPENDPDQRTPGQRDRDRVLYSFAFRRLAGVTQVVNPLEGQVFHNRLTHTLEAAQIARRIAERTGLFDGWPLPDPDVVEAAALAHDLGHPPFGHVGEKTLDECVRRWGAIEGFEGNAQSFRIVTRLEAHRNWYVGLNLTRATLNGLLKYPWSSGENPAKPDKFGYYRSDADDFDFARADFQSTMVRSIEAQIMDYADSVAYSVHDLDDFYRAGLVPLEQLSDELPAVVTRLKESGKVSPEDVENNYDTLENLLDILPCDQRYRGTRAEREILATATSELINRFVGSISVVETDGRPLLHVEPVIDVQLRFLQKLVWDNVIASPRLVTQQYGQRRAIRFLFCTYCKAIKNRDDRELRAADLIPAPFADRLSGLPKGDPAEDARLAADIVASFTDNQALTMFRRLSGIAIGSVNDSIDG